MDVRLEWETGVRAGNPGFGRAVSRVLYGVIFGALSVRQLEGEGGRQGLCTPLGPFRDVSFTLVATLVDYASCPARTTQQAG